MSWTWRRPRVPVEPTPGWQAPHELVDEHAKRGVTIAELTGALAHTELMLSASRAEIRNLNGQIRDLEGRIERQADVFEEMREQADTANRRIRHLEETIVALGAGRVTTGWQLADSWWDDVAGVAGPEGSRQ